MADPAKLLHAQLSEWSKSEVLDKARNLRSPTGWHQQRAAVVNLDHVMTLLDRLDAEEEDTAPFRKYTVQLHQAVFGYGTDWRASQHRSVETRNPVDEHALNSLLMVSMAVKHLIPKLEDDGLQTFEDMLNDEVLQQPSDEFPYELKTYFIRVRDHLAWCVNHFNEVGEFELHEAAMQFRMTVLFMAAGAPEGEQERWYTFLREKFAWPFITTTVTAQPAAWAQTQLGQFGQKVLELMTGSGG